MQKFTYKFYEPRCIRLICLNDFIVGIIQYDINLNKTVAKVFCGKKLAKRLPTVPYIQLSFFCITLKQKFTGFSGAKDFLDANTQSIIDHYTLLQGIKNPDHLPEFVYKLNKKKLKESA